MQCKKSTNFTTLKRFTINTLTHHKDHSRNQASNQTSNTNRQLY